MQQPLTLSVHDTVILDPFFEEARHDMPDASNSKTDNLLPAVELTANMHHACDNFMLADEDTDLVAHITQIFDINDPIRKLYTLYCLQQAEINEVEACLLKEIMCLRTIITRYLEYDDLWRDTHGDVLQKIDFQKLSMQLANQLEKEASEKLEVFFNSCAVQTLTSESHSIHVQTISPPSVRCATSTDSSTDPDANFPCTYLSNDVKRPTQLHNPLIGKMKQMHELLEEKEARIASLSSELANLREKLTTSQSSLAFEERLLSGQVGGLRRPITGQEAKLVVKQRSASAGMYTFKPVQEPLATVEAQRASSTKRHLSFQKEIPPITSADLVPKTVLMNLHKSISEKDSLLAEKSEIIVAQQKQISWLKEMLQANTVEKRKTALQSSIHTKFQPQLENSVSIDPSPSVSSQKPRCRKSQKIEAMLGALELESQVMSLKNQLSDISNQKTIPAETMSRLTLLENELAQKSIYLTDLEASAPLHSLSASPDVLDDEISQLIANQRSILETAERSIPRITEPSTK